LLHRAADELGIQLSASFMIGDRLSDVSSGRDAGCTTALIESGAHEAPLIVGMPSKPPAPDYRFPDLLKATQTLLVHGR
jgi:D-glycero-D-manno-heptose 1,7-bisphosphate phosphatase